MYVVKVLKRKDASSLVVGVTVAMFLLQFVGTMSMELSSRIALWQWGKSAPGNQGFYGGAGWRSTYLQAVVALLVQLLVLEVLVRLYVWVHQMATKKS